MLDTGCSMLDARYWILDTGCWMLDAGCSMLDAGCSILDTGCSILDTRYWMLDTRYSILDTRCLRLDAGYWLLVAGKKWRKAHGSRRTAQELLIVRFSFPHSQIPNPQSNSAFKTLSSFFFPPSAFRIPHSKLCLHFSFHLPHSEFRIQNSVFCHLSSAQCFPIPHSAFRLPHSVFFHSEFRIQNSSAIGPKPINKIRPGVKTQIGEKNWVLF